MVRSPVVSQYPLIWAVASDPNEELQALATCWSQYPLIWAVASDAELDEDALSELGLNTLSFGQ